jgi:FAD-dependent oxidoreductase family protein
MRYTTATVFGSIVAFCTITCLAADIDTSQLKPYGPEMEGFRKPQRETKMLVDGFLWIDTEDFTDYGGWRFETQFVYNMGSPYLLAGGTGTPVADAKTTIKIPKAGNYRLWVRAKNWHPPDSPGQFHVLVDGKKVEKVYGAESHDRWTWCSGGEFDLKAGEVTLTLCDRTGYFARCDAFILTTDLDYTPPEKVDAINKERSRLTGVSLEPQDGGSFDVIVVGAGTAGCSAAIAAARSGAKTALVQNRPVLGGNASVELGVGVNGAGTHQSNARESGIVEEAGRIKARFKQPRVSESYRILTEQEKNLTVLVNRHVFGVDMADKTTISAVRALDTLTGEIYVYQGRHFIDCTGDGWVGYYAGAKYRMGREPSSEFDEDLAPAEADRITMSGCLMGNMAISFRGQDVGKPVTYTPPPWAAKLPTNDFGRSIRRITGGEWWLEHEGTVDDLYRPEFARDELIRITFGYWDYLKNHWEGRAAARTFDLVFVPHGDAKRETRRLVGDYLLTQQDVLQAVMFPDRISYGGWGLDIHHPRGIYSGAEGPFDYNPRVPIYSIPYRCLYSVNIDNLQFAGRDVSVTHVALGSVRVQSTLATLGQATGTAAAMCLQHGATPRQIGQDHITELQQRLLKDDQYIPNLRNEDPADAARTAKVTASSHAAHEIFRRANVHGDEIHPLNMPRAVMLPRGIHRELKSVRLLLHNYHSEPVEVTAHLRGAAETGDFSSEDDLCTATATAPSGQSFVEFPVDTEIDAPIVWVWLPKTEGVSWRLMTTGPYGACRAYGGGKNKSWTVVKNQYYGIYTDPPMTYEIDCGPESVINGISRIVERTPNQWMSDSTQPLPQWIELEFPEPTTINTVYLTFDTDMNASHCTVPLVPQCVRDYELSCLADGHRVSLATVTENFQRRRVHRFDPVKAKKLMLFVAATNGDRSARVFEIRAYNERGVGQGGPAAINE